MTDELLKELHDQIRQQIKDLRRVKKLSYENIIQYLAHSLGNDYSPVSEMNLETAKKVKRLLKERLK